MQLFIFCQEMDEKIDTMCVKYEAEVRRRLAQLKNWEKG